MTTLHWEPHEEPTAQERMLLKTVRRTKKLFGFLRLNRMKLFDEAFQEELAAVYRRTGAGKVPHPPAFMAMVVLLQRVIACEPPAQIAQSFQTWVERL